MSEREQNSDGAFLEENAAKRPHLVDGKQCQLLKRQRFKEKQARKRDIENREQERNKWMAENAHFCSFLQASDVAQIRNRGTSTSSGDTGSSPLSHLLEPYLDLKEGNDGRPNIVEGPKLFIAEGTETVKLLLQQTRLNKGKEDSSSNIKVLSVLVKPSTFFEEPVKLLDEVSLTFQELGTDTCEREQKNPPPFHVLVGTENVLSSVTGFHISRGALACGVVPQRDDEWLNQFISEKSSEDVPFRILALDSICDTANLGSMIRNAAAFGIDVMILSDDCCDAWYRRSVRVSMGHIFSVPVVRVKDLAQTISTLAGTGVSSFAAVIDGDILLGKMETIPSRWCCVMGNEANGISPAVRDSCTSTVRIDIVSTVDSLSVPVATGILLHGLRERETT